MKSTGSKTALAIIAGLAVGAGIYLLLSEDNSGLKQKIKDAFKGKIDEFKNFFENITEDLQGKLGDQFSDAKEEFDQVVSNVEDYSDEAIQKLESKLSALKEKAEKAKAQYI